MTPLGYLRLLCWLHMCHDDRVAVAHVHAAFDFWAETQIGAAS